MPVYHAILHGDRLEWMDDPPSVSSPIHVQILFSRATETVLAANGAAMAQALEDIARTGGISAISNPREWQQEVRQDKPLPGGNE